MSEANRNQYQLFLDRKSLLVENQNEGLRASIRLEVAKKLCVRAVIFFLGTYGHLGPEWSHTFYPIPDAGFLGDVDKIDRTACVERTSV